MNYLKLALACTAALAVWSVFALVLAFYGWWMEPAAEQDDVAAFMNWAVDEIETNNRGTAARVLIEEGVVVQRYFSEKVDERTMFPTASFSKWITALAVMALVEQGLVDLDAPVSKYLSRWQLPDSSFDNGGVTVRRLLSHTAGLTDGLGLGDYESHETLP